MVNASIVTAERLYDDQRAQIQKIFGCRVANGYGGRDAGFIAHECPVGGMHISAEDIIVEIIDSDGNPVPKGTAGEIVITHLATKDFPFIRYRTGDVAALDDKPCSCGRSLPLIKEIQGRTTDFVVAENGTVMHGLALVYTLRALPGVKQFKIIQETLTDTHVLLVTDEAFKPEYISNIQRDFKARLGAGVQVTVETLADIAPEQSGKFRYVVSKVGV